MPVHFEDARALAGEWRLMSANRIATELRSLERIAGELASELTPANDAPPTGLREAKVWAYGPMMKLIVGLDDLRDAPDAARMRRLLARWTAHDLEWLRILGPWSRRTLRQLHANAPRYAAANLPRVKTFLVPARYGLRLQEWLVFRQLRPTWVVGAPLEPKILR